MVSRLAGRERNLQMKKVLILVLAAAAMGAAPVYKVVGNIRIGGVNRTDYTYCDSANHRLYVAHGTQTEVIDTATGKLIGAIPDTQGVHGIAIASDLGKGFTSNGATNNVTVFDVATLKVTGKIGTGKNPDSIVYEPVTHRVFTFNGKSKDATVFDAKTGEIISASVALGGKPEFCQVDGKGHVYVNMEDKNEIVEINAKDATVTRRYSIAPCDSPSGLALDAKKNVLFSVCDNKVMIVSDPASGKVLATPAIGSGPDGVAFDDGYAFSANREGNITMVGESAPGKYDVVATIPTQLGARTIGADQKAHKLYLPTAEYGAPAASKDGKAGRPQAVPDSFMILVVGR